MSWSAAGGRRSGCEVLDLSRVVVRRDHAGELGLVVERRAVVEHDGGQRLWKLVDRRGREGGRLDDRSQRVALAAALDAEEADRVRFVEIERDRPAEGVLAEDAKLRVTARWSRGKRREAGRVRCRS